MRGVVLLLLSILLNSLENEINKTKEINIYEPKPKIDSSTNIKTYSTEEVFAFESDAKKECEKRTNVLKNYGLKVLGCNILEKENNYTFTIEYLPLLSNPNSINSVLIKDYTSPKTYWNESFAKREMENSFSNFKNSPLKVIDKKIIEAGDEYTFTITYVVENVLKKTKTYYGVFNKATYGRYTFQSDAEKDIPSALNILKNAGISVVRARVLEYNSDYTIEVEYLNKSDRTDIVSEKPLYTITTYISEETFPFEDDALKEGIKRNNAFTKAGAFVVHNYAVACENDWTFAFDFCVKNIYKGDYLIGKEVLVKRYTNPQTFDFENDAKKNMNEKINNFNNSGLYVISAKIFEITNNYSFFIDYLEKQQNYQKEE